MGEIQRLLKQYEPLAICLQHTNETIPKIGNYNLAAHSIPDVKGEVRLFGDSFCRRV